MKYQEIYGDLFKVDDKYYLCHCISADFALGKGIAVEFNKRYDMKNALNRMYMKDADFPVCLRVGKVYNLVTKAKYWYKPTYQTLYGALLDMKNQIVKDNVHYLAMPLIGSGLDRLEWFRVSKMIQEMFKDLDIEILVVRK